MRALARRPEHRTKSPSFFDSGVEFTPQPQHLTRPSEHGADQEVRPSDQIARDSPEYLPRFPTSDSTSLQQPHVEMEHPKFPGLSKLPESAATKRKRQGPGNSVKPSESTATHAKDMPSRGPDHRDSRPAKKQKIKEPLPLSVAAAGPSEPRNYLASIAEKKVFEGLFGSGALSETLSAVLTPDKVFNVPSRNQRIEQNDSSNRPLQPSITGRHPISGHFKSRGGMSGKYHLWSDEEDRILLDAVRKGMSQKRISELMTNPKRTTKSIQHRLAELRKREEDPIQRQLELHSDPIILSQSQSQSRHLSPRQAASAYSSRTRQLTLVPTKTTQTKLMVENGVEQQEPYEGKGKAPVYNGTPPREQFRRRHNHRHPDVVIPVEPGMAKRLLSPASRPSTRDSVSAAKGGFANGDNLERSMSPSDQLRHEIEQASQREDSGVTARDELEYEDEDEPDAMEDVNQASQREESDIIAPDEFGYDDDDDDAIEALIAAHEKPEAADHAGDSLDNVLKVSDSDSDDDSEESSDRVIVPSSPPTAVRKRVRRYFNDQADEGEEEDAEEEVDDEDVRQEDGEDIEHSESEDDDEREENESEDVDDGDYQQVDDNDDAELSEEWKENFPRKSSKFTPKTSAKPNTSANEPPLKLVLKHPTPSSSSSSDESSSSSEPESNPDNKAKPSARRKPARESSSSSEESDSDESSDDEPKAKSGAQSKPTAMPKPARESSSSSEESDSETRSDDEPPSSNAKKSSSEDDLVKNNVKPVLGTTTDGRFQATEATSKSKQPVQAPRITQNPSASASFSKSVQPNGVKGSMSAAEQQPPRIAQKLSASSTKAVQPNRVTASTSATVPVVQQYVNGGWQAPPAPLTAAKKKETLFEALNSHHNEVMERIAAREAQQAEQAAASSQGSSGGKRKRNRRRKLDPETEKKLQKLERKLEKQKRRPGF